MTRELIFRTVAGTLVLASLALWRWVSPWWFLLTLRVGLNLLQSGLTGWRLLDDILRKVFGVPSEADNACRLGEKDRGVPETDL